MEPLVVPQGTFALDRYPTRPGDPLRAWDAADELALRHLHTVAATAPGTTVVVVNDAWGALATALAVRMPVVVSDSYLARRAVVHNVRRHAGDAETAVAAVAVVADIHDAPERVDLAVVRVPKSLALLRHQLDALAPRLHPRSTVIGIGMVKHLPPSAHLLFQELIGPTHPSRAEKKARLIHCEPDAALVGPGRRSTPANPMDSFVLEPEGLHVVGYPGVFSSARLDLGTRLLLAQLPRDIPAADGRARIVDLGCGNGVVGLVGALRNPDAEVVFVDESSLAVRSAETNWRAAFGTARDARFVEGNGLSDVDGDPIEAGSVDLVATNPPFHREHTVGDQTAWQFFVDARDALAPGGQLLVVGNRHLGYHVKVKRLFGDAQVVAADPKFVVLRAVRR
jgi:23S rRNA (guanine1835-N2)-methyltransferase